MKTKNEIKSDLLALKDDKYAQFNSKICPNAGKMIGVRIPLLRNYAKKISKTDKLVELIKQIDDEYYEEIMLQGMLIGLLKTDFKTISLCIADFVLKINNWAVCDVFCGSLKITKKYQDEMWHLIHSYIYSKHEFEVRFALVMILSYYMQEKYLEDIFNIFNHIKASQYYVLMGLAWAISVALVKYYDQTLSFLKNAHLDDFTYNMAISKALDSYRISPLQKEELVKLKRKKVKV